MLVHANLSMTKFSTIAFSFVPPSHDSSAVREVFRAYAWLCSSMWCISVLVYRARVSVARPPAAP